MSLPTREEIRAVAMSELVSKRPELAGDDTDVPTMDAEAATDASDYVIGATAREVKGFFLDGAEGDVLVARGAEKNVTKKAATKAIGTISTLTRTSTVAELILPAGTPVATLEDAAGNKVRVLLDASATFAIGVAQLTNRAATAEVAGLAGNIQANTLSKVEGSFGDTITATNTDRFAGGGDEESDAEYRERIRMKPKADEKGTKNAIEFAALSVAGVRSATAVLSALGIVTVYISDQAGGANNALLTAARTAIENYIAWGADWGAQAGAVVTQNVTVGTMTARPGLDLTSQDLRDRIAQAMKSWADKLKHGETLRRQDLEAAGKAVDEKLLTVPISTPGADVVPAANQVARIGTVTFG